MAEGKKHRKFGRNADYCKSYRAFNVEAKNRRKRMLRTIKRQPTNESLISRFKELHGADALPDEVIQTALKRIAKKQRRREQRAA